MKTIKETLGKISEMCLLEWNIDSIFTLTVDNFQQHTCKVLEKHNNRLETNRLRSYFLHMRCRAHILNLIFGDGLKELNASIACIRDLVGYVMSSLSRYDNFKKCAEKEKIDSRSGVCLDVPTRWNSTYLMLEAAQIYQRAFGRLWEENSNCKEYMKLKAGERVPIVSVGYEANEGEDEESGSKKIPNKDDWDNCRLFVKFLKYFYFTTKRISGSLYVTSNTFFDEMFVIQIKIEKLVKNGDEFWCKMATNMKEKLEKYWGMGTK